MIKLCIHNNSFIFECMCNEYSSCSAYVSSSTALAAIYMVYACICGLSSLLTLFGNLTTKYLALSVDVEPTLVYPGVLKHPLRFARSVTQ